MNQSQLNTESSGLKPAGCPAWWPFGTVPNPPTLRDIERQIVESTEEALL